MAIIRPSWQTWRRIAIGIAGTLIVLILLVRFLATTPFAHNLVETRLEAANIRGQSIEIDGLSGDLLGKMSITRLTVSDADGVWMSAFDVELGWRPLSYLFDNLSLTEISAQKINVARRPELAPSQSAGGGVGQYSVAALNLYDLSLAEGVAGPMQSYTVTGALESKGGLGSLRLDLSATGQSGDDIRANLAWGVSAPIIGSVSLEGAPNGLVATLLQAPPDAAIRFNLDASAEQDAWQFEADATVGEKPALDMALEISDQVYRGQGEIALNTIGRLAPLNARLGDELRFQARVGTDNQLTATADSESFTAELSGQMIASLQGVVIEALDLSARDLDAARLSSTDTISLSTLNAEGVFSMAPGDIQFDGALSTPQILLSGVQSKDVRLEGSVNVSAAAISSEMRMTLQSVSGLPDALADLVDGSVSARFSGDYLLDTHQVRARTLLLETGVLWALGNGSASLDGAVNLEGEMRLREYAAISGMQTEWALTGGSFDALQLKLDGTAEISERNRTLRDLAGPRATFDVTARRSKDGLFLDPSTVSSEHVFANISGTLNNQNVDLRGRINARQLDQAQYETDRFNTYFILSGTAAAPRLLFTAMADSVGLSGQTLIDPVITLDATITEDTPFRLTADAVVSNAPLELDLYGKRTNDSVEIFDLSASALDLQAKGSAMIDPRAWSNSTLALDITGTTPLSGSVDAHIDYANQNLDTDIAITNFKVGTLEIERSAIQMSGTWPVFEGQLAYQGESPIFGTAQRISGQHALRVDADSRALRLAGRATLADQAIELTTPLTLFLGPEARLSGAMTGFGGELQIEADADGRTPSELTFSDLEMSAIGPLINRPSLSGTLGGTFNVALVDDDLIGGGTARLAQLSRNVVDAQATDLVLDVEIEANQLSAQLRTEDDTNELNFEINLTAPLRHSSTLASIRLPTDAGIPVSIIGSGAVGPLWALAAPTNLRLEGDLVVDLNNGTGQSWRFSGPLALREATFEDGFTGLHLRDISTSAQLQPNGIAVEQMEARGSRSGRISGAGLYDFDGNGSVTLTLSGLNALKRSDVSGAISGTAQIERQNRRTLISGDLELDQARINLERLPSAGYTTLDVVFTDEIAAKTGSTPEREAIELRLDVIADRRIFVAGSGVDTEWGLDARVTGPLGRPNIIGRANLIRGEADLLSRRFRFSEGSIRFVGAPMDSQLSIRADRTSDDITSSISLSGTLSDPELSLSSDPSLPNDEILSRVLFGRSPSELSPLQAAQLAGAAAQLAGGDALNLVGQIQAATGLDRLDIGLNEDGAATLSTGKYIADDVYLEIESGVTGAPGVALEWTPLENVAVDAEVDPELGPKVAIQWKRDFDHLPGEAERD